MAEDPLSFAVGETKNLATALVHLILPRKRPGSKQ